MASLAISALATGAVRLKIQPNASRRLSQGFGRKVFPLASYRILVYQYIKSKEIYVPNVGRYIPGIEQLGMSHKGKYQLFMYQCILAYE